MIGYVKGILEEADDQCIIVDNHGIGYRIFVPGIGKKTAQKLILELKDKLDLEDAFEQKLANQSAAGIPETEGDNQLQEAVQALVALGYPNTDALRAVKKVEGAETMDVETLLKAALKKMI